MSKLVIVESPAKAKTIKKYLGRNYQVVASMGHIRDLPKSKMGVDIENDFEPSYINIRGKGDLIKKLKKEAEKSSSVFLATDPDREGEAISWHLSFILGLDNSKKNRVTFNEITKDGINNGMKNARTIDFDLVDAQQARRVIDRLVGYKLSPFLWRKIGPGLSAGRVQSVAVRLIVDRENEIKAFVPQEFWTIEATLQKEGYKKTFVAKLHSKGGKKLEIKDEKQSKEILKELEGAKYEVTKIKKGTRKRSPSPPFTTSTLQQEASRKLYFQSSKTMRVAQQLYEGVNIKDMGATGLITYMRTDSLRISEEARNEAKNYIETHFSKEYLPQKPIFYKSKSNSQDGHEAIRPTMPNLAPLDVKDSLTNEQYKLYKLIWERFMASQMADAIYDTLAVDIKAYDFLFKANGKSVKFKGFMALYIEGNDENKEEKDIILPPLEEKDILKLIKLLNIQHFTQPPPRFSEASLTKTLEELGIGRPSTYVPIISTILQRGYVEKDKRLFIPTPLGEIITTLMKDEFSSIVDVSFTAKMEEEFDKIAKGSYKWKDSVRIFYNDFDETLKKAEKDMEGKRLSLPVEETDEKCENCGKPMVVKTGRFGKFLACSGYPDCKTTKPLTKPTKGICPVCGGKIKEKKSIKKKKIYYGCEHYPECNFMSWDEPVEETCPKCGNTMFKKKDKNKTIYCAKEGCGYTKK